MMIIHTQTRVAMIFQATTMVDIAQQMMTIHTHHHHHTPVTMKTSQLTTLVLQPSTMMGYGAHRGVPGPPRGILGPLGATLKLNLYLIMVPIR
jgi:hypothetical protein